MASVRKTLSWIWPFHVKKVAGKITPVLEIAFEHGKKVLHAGEVNYSFGVLHDVFRIALQKAKIIEHPPKDVLILGFGAGSIASIIVEEFGQNPNMVGVEADPVVIQIARDEFNLARFSELEIENTFAEKYISSTDKKFDLIAVDVFVEAIVPAACMSEEFLKNLYEHLNENGRVVFNQMPGNKFSDRDEFSNRFRNCFDELEIHKLHVGGSPNRIFIGYRRSKGN